MEKDNKDAIEFIKFIKSLSEGQQAGVLQIIQGVVIVHKSKKARQINRRSLPEPL